MEVVNIHRPPTASRCRLVPDIYNEEIDYEVTFIFPFNLEISNVIGEYF